MAAGDRSLSRFVLMSARQSPAAANQSRLELLVQSPADPGVTVASRAA